MIVPLTLANPKSVTLILSFPVINKFSPFRSRWIHCKRKEPNQSGKANMKTRRTFLACRYANARAISIAKLIRNLQGNGFVLLS